MGKHNATNMCCGSANVTISCAVDSDQTSSPQLTEPSDFTSILQRCAELDGLIAKTTTPVLSRSVHKIRLESRLLRTKLRSARQITTVRAQCHTKLKERASEGILRDRGSYRRRLQKAHVLLQLRIRQSRGQMIRNWREALKEQVVSHIDPANIDTPRCELTASEPAASEPAIDANGHSAVSVTQETVLSPKRNKLRNTISELIKFHSNHSPRSISAV